VGLPDTADPVNVVMPEPVAVRDMVNVVGVGAVLT
jgi:hypothetical protein